MLILAGNGMKSLLLMSVVLVTLLAPLAAARRRNAVAAARWLFFFFVGFSFCYALYVGFVHTLFVPQRW